MSNYNNVHSNIKTLCNRSNNLEENEHCLENSKIIKQKYKSYDKDLLLALTNIISNDSIYFDEQGIRKIQNQEIKRLFTSESGYFDKRKKNAYIKHLLDTNIVKYNERYLEIYLETNRSTFKIKNDPTYDYSFSIKMLKNATLRSGKTFYDKIDLKHLNQSVYLKFKEEDCFFTISGNLKLPEYGNGTMTAFKRSFIVYLLQNCIKKITKQNSMQTAFLEKILEKEKLKHSLYKDLIFEVTSRNSLKRDIRRLELKHVRKLGINSYHNILLKMKIKNTRENNISLWNSSRYFTVMKSRSSIEGNYDIVYVVIKRGIIGAILGGIDEFAERAMPLVCEALGVERADVESVEVRSYERAMPVLRESGIRETGISELNKQNNNKRDLAYLGYSGFSDYVDYSEGYPEYELKVVNRDNKSVAELAVIEKELLDCKYSDIEKVDIVNRVLDSFRYYPQRKKPKQRKKKLVVIGLGNIINKWINRVKKGKITKIERDMKALMDLENLEVQNYNNIWKSIAQNCENNIISEILKQIVEIYSQNAGKPQIEIIANREMRFDYNKKSLKKLRKGSNGMNRTEVIRSLYATRP